MVMTFKKHNNFFLFKKNTLKFESNICKIQTYTQASQLNLISKNIIPL